MSFPFTCSLTQLQEWTLKFCAFSQQPLTMIQPRFIIGAGHCWWRHHVTTYLVNMYIQSIPRFQFKGQESQPFSSRVLFLSHYHMDFLKNSGPRISKLSQSSSAQNSFHITTWEVHVLCAKWQVKRMRLMSMDKLIAQCVGHPSHWTGITCNTSLNTWAHIYSMIWNLMHLKNSLGYASGQHPCVKSMSKTGVVWRGDIPLIKKNQIVQTWSFSTMGTLQHLQKPPLARMFLPFALSVQQAARLSRHTVSMPITENVTSSLPSPTFPPIFTYLNLRKMACNTFGKLVSSNTSPTIQRISCETNLLPSLKPTVQGFPSCKSPTSTTTANSYIPAAVTKAAILPSLQV